MSVGLVCSSKIILLKGSYATSCLGTGIVSTSNDAGHYLRGRHIARMYDYSTMSQVIRRICDKRLATANRLGGFKIRASLGVIVLPAFSS